MNNSRPPRGRVTSTSSVQSGPSVGLNNQQNMTTGRRRASPALMAKKSSSQVNIYANNTFPRLDPRGSGAIPKRNRAAQGPPPVPRLDLNEGKSTNVKQTNQERSRVNSGSPNSGSMDHFDALREVIYSEVATLISLNENHPQFLLEMFRELQLVSTDFLKTHALQAIRELLKKYLVVTANSEHETTTELESPGADSERSSAAALEFMVKHAAFYMQFGICSIFYRIRIFELC